MGKKGGGRTCWNPTGVGWREGLQASGIEGEELGFAARRKWSGILALISACLKLFLFTRGTMRNVLPVPTRHPLSVEGRSK